MSFFSGFLVNICILITCGYLLNLAFKFFFEKAALPVRNVALACIFVILGWLSMRFGIRGEGYSLFDLRAVPIIFGTLEFRNPRYLITVAHRAGQVHDLRHSAQFHYGRNQSAT